MVGMRTSKGELKGEGNLNIIMELGNGLAGEQGKLEVVGNINTRRRTIEKDELTASTASHGD